MAAEPLWMLLMKPRGSAVSADWVPLLSTLPIPEVKAPPLRERGPLPSYQPDYP